MVKKVVKYKNFLDQNFFLGLSQVAALYTTDMFTFTKEILNGKVHFCALICASK